MEAQKLSDNMPGRVVRGLGCCGALMCLRGVPERVRGRRGGQRGVLCGVEGSGVVRRHLGVQGGQITAFTL